MNHIHKLIAEAQRKVNSTFLDATKKVSYEPRAWGGYSYTYTVPMLQPVHDDAGNAKLMQSYYVDVIKEIAELATNKALELHPNIEIIEDSKLAFDKFIFEVSSMIAHKDRFYQGFARKDNPLLNEEGNLLDTEMFLSASFVIVQVDETRRVLIYKSAVTRMITADDGKLHTYILKDLYSEVPKIVTYSYYDYSLAVPLVSRITGTSILDADAHVKEGGLNPQRLSCSVGVRYVLVDRNLVSSKQLHDHTGKPCEVLKNDGAVYTSRTFDNQLGLVKVLSDHLKEDPIHFTHICFEYPSGVHPMERLEF